MSSSRWRLNCSCKFVEALWSNASESDSSFLGRFDHNASTNLQEQFKRQRELLIRALRRSAAVEGELGTLQDDVTRRDLVIHKLTQEHHELQEQTEQQYNQFQEQQQQVQQQYQMQQLEQHSQCQELERLLQSRWLQVRQKQQEHQESQQQVAESE